MVVSCVNNDEATRGYIFPCALESPPDLKSHRLALNLNDPLKIQKWIAVSDKDALDVLNLPFSQPYVDQRAVLCMSPSAPIVNRTELTFLSKRGKVNCEIYDRNRLKLFYSLKLWGKCNESLPLLADGLSYSFGLGAAVLRQLDLKFI